MYEKMRIYSGSVSTGMIGSDRELTVEIPESEASAMSPQELHSYLKECFLDDMWNYVELYYDEETFETV